MTSCAKWVASFSYSFAKPPSLVLRLCAKQCCLCYFLSAHFSLSFQLTLKRGFSLTVVSVSIHLIFLPSLLLFLIILLILSTDQCRASAKHGCPFYLAHAAASLQCQGLPDGPCPFFLPLPTFFLGLTCLFKFRRENIELIVFMEEWQSNMRAMPACCNLSHTATHYGRVIAYRGRKRGVEKEGGDIQLPTSLTFIVCMG